MVANSLQDDLLGIPGVEGAEVDGSQDAPAGLRIRIAEGADQEAVGGAIRRVLSSHGLGTDTKLPGEVSDQIVAEQEESRVAVLTASEESDADEISMQADEPRAIIDLTDATTDEAPAMDADSIGSEALQASDQPGSWTESDAPPFVEPRPVVSSPVGQASVVPEDSAVGVSRFESVAVVEGRSGITVTVRATDGSETSQPASSSEGGVEAAVVKAAARLVNEDSPDPIVVEIEDRRVEGVDLVLIILDVDGELVTGSAVVAAGRPFALGRATWAALAL